MDLFLIRHAHAEDGPPDHLRPLSARGRTQLKVLGEFLSRCGRFDPEEIWHSPLLRARETAELIQRRVHPSVPLREAEHLTPADDPRLLARRLANLPRRVAVVGHEPHLSALASLLVTGASEPPRFAMKKAAVLALEGGGSQWIVRWHVWPDLLA
ncbi:MAG: phosphohistidine phosphatase SixA [Verrucomicrobia bacterium]|nr:phosphohistidine phosphatase SixA [Verrucomicrobiota bacterium]